MKSPSAEFIGLSFGVLLLAALACNTWDAPISTTPSKDYPCGVIGVMCTNPETGAFTHMCCNQDNICGGSKFVTGCPAGECCFIGSDHTFSLSDAGAYDVAPTPQFPAK